MNRMDRVNELMKREISALLQRESQDPRLAFVTITGVKVTPDLQLARVSFSVLGPKANLAEVENGLNSARGFVRKLVGQRVELRRIPEIEFVYDPSMEYSDRVEQTLDDIKKEAPPAKSAQNE